MQLTTSDLHTQGVEFGQRPALIVVDMSVGFVSPESPLGGHFSSQIHAAAKLIDHFYAKELPVFFSTVVYDSPQQQSVFRTHLPSLDVLQRGSEWVSIDPRLTVSSKATIIEKTAPSAFFNTALQEQLLKQRIDSLMVCGLTTSGCVRATVVDGLSYNYPVWVVEQACGDRNADAHAANLHDMHAKYAKVVSFHHVADYFKAHSVAKPQKAGAE